MANILKVGMLFIILSFIISCQSEYDKAVKEGLSSGIVHDSLIFGLRIGHDRKKFYEICWDLNKKGIIREGPGNMSARYVEPYATGRDSSMRKEMLFYGMFDDKDVMYGMEMTYSYTGYVPHDSLRNHIGMMKELKKQFMNDLNGNPFMEIKLDDGRSTFVKIDGNRQILLVPKSNREVAVRIQDLRHKVTKKDKEKS